MEGDDKNKNGDDAVTFKLLLIFHLSGNATKGPSKATSPVTHRLEVTR